MVKSFQGARSEVKTGAEDQLVTVADHMARSLITFKPDQLIDEVVTKLLEHNISGAPVINDRNELIGVISEGDCLKEVAHAKYHNLPMLGSKVEDRMAKDVVHIKPTLNIFEAAKMFLDMKVRRLPVVDDNGKLVGQISQRDILIAVMNMRGETWH